jgi:O-acetyl-ADP-ribose deacetylase (regulator of RNase III)
VRDCLVERLRRGGGSRPELLLLERERRRVVVKDYSASGWLLRAYVGPWLLDREERTYRALLGAPGVPRLIGRIDRWALAVEYVDGRNCTEFPDGSLPPEFFERLRHVVEGIHSRRIVHCDIKNRSNIVVTGDFEPYIVDFASAFTKEGSFGPVRRRAFERFRLDDLRAVVKARLLGGRIWSDADAHFAFYRSPGERAVRLVRDAARWIFKLAAGRQQETRPEEVGSVQLRVVEGDICDRDVDAIVNAANSHLWMGGGVAGAIKRRGGQEIEREATERGPIPVGESVVTGAGRLIARHVIHAAVMGPDLVTSAEDIRRAMLSALVRARELELKSIAFPALGTGVGGFPVDECAQIMRDAAAEHARPGTSLETVEFVLFDQEAYAAFSTTIDG